MNWSVIIIIMIDIFTVFSFWIWPKATHQCNNRTRLQIIPFGILNDREIAQECVNDVYLQAWNSIPPQRPSLLNAYLGKITRNLALNRLKREHAQKRGGTQFDLVLEELESFVAEHSALEEAVDMNILTDILNSFLSGQSAQNRNIFLRRYWKFEPIKEIAGFYGMSETKVKSILFRMRNKLEKALRKEGIFLWRPYKF